MDIDKLFESDSLDGIADNVFGVVNNSVSEVKEMQRKKVAENVQLVVNALKKIESDISSRYDSVGNALEKRIITIKDGRDGADGRDGRNGKDGKNGRDGAPGPRGADGKNGIDGADGTDGISVTNAHIDFDGSLVISLSSGQELNVGEVVAPALAEQIKVITNGGGTSQSVIDTLASLQAQITALGTAAVYKGLWNASTNTPTLTSSVGTSGNFYIVSVAGSTNLNGITNWGVGDWAIYNGTAWQRVEGGAAGNFTTVTASSLTSGRVTYAGTAGLLQDSANLTFNGTTLTASYLDISNITAERIPYNAGTGGLTVSSNLQFTGDNTLVVSGITIGKGAGNMSFNSAFGYRAIYATATGNYNTALGAYAATATTTGQANSFSGYSAGARNTTGSYNSVVGYNAYADPLLLGTFGTGSYNCALGNATLISNTTGAGNIAIGTQSLGANTTGSYSTSVGYNAGLVVVGATNAFFGYNAGSTMTSGNYNVIIGSYTGASTPIANSGSNYIVLSDGQANVRAYWNGANATFNGGLAVTGTLSSTLDATIYGLTVGRGAGAVATNTAVGASALSSGSQSGTYNTAIGYTSLNSNTTGSYNVAFGASSLSANTTGQTNNSFGWGSLTSNVTGSNNCAFGHGALNLNTAGNNTAFGHNALVGNTSGTGNVAVGVQALNANSTATGSTAVGYQALYTSNRTADVSAYNSAFGYQAGYQLGTGQFNTFIGLQAGYSCSSGAANTFIGVNASGSGAGSSVTGSKNVIIGGYSGSAAPISATGSNYVVLSDGDGNIVASSKTAQTFALQGGTLSAGTGIAFPATQSASTDANTLDDYEEGTFNPVVKGYTTAGTATYSRQQGYYTKIGNRVFINIDLIWTSGTGTGDLFVDGLVFPTSSSVMIKNYAVLTDGIALTVGNYLAGAGSGISSTAIYIYQSSVGTTTQLAVPYDAAGSITISGQYFV